MGNSLNDCTGCEYINDDGGYCYDCYNCSKKYVKDSETLKVCGECLYFHKCKEYVTEDESFPEVEKGCHKFIRKGGCDD